MSKSGLFGHFGSKEALQHAVLESVVDDFRGRVILPALREPGGLARTTPPVRAVARVGVRGAARRRLPAARRIDRARRSPGRAARLPGREAEGLARLHRADRGQGRRQQTSSAPTSTLSNSRSSSTTSASASISLIACSTTRARGSARSARSQPWSRPRPADSRKREDSHEPRNNQEKSTNVRFIVTSRSGAALSGCSALTPLAAQRYDCRVGLKQSARRSDPSARANACRARRSSACSRRSASPHGPAGLH